VIFKNKKRETLVNKTSYLVEGPLIDEISGVRLDEAIPEG
jgi:hypothetical protein